MSEHEKIAEVKIIMPVDKDKVLRYLISSSYPAFEVDFVKIKEDAGLSSSEVMMVLGQLERMNLIKKIGYSGGCSVTLYAELHDYIRRGGFVKHEELFMLEFEKLNDELINLREEVDPSLVSKINTALEIVAKIATVLNLFPH